MKTLMRAIELFESNRTECILSWFGLCIFGCLMLGL